MHSDLRAALKLQQLDARAAELKREIAALPRHIADIERTLASHIRKLEADKAALSQNNASRKKLDLEVQTQQQKISRLRDQMLQAKTNEQYRAFQHEIEYCETAIRKAEDQILALMEVAEGLETNVKSSEESLALEKKAVEADKEKTRARTAQDEAELQQVVSTRAETFRELPPDLAKEYERLRLKHKDGIAIAQAKDGMCLACQMLLRPQLWQEVRTDAAVVSCENCRRLLYYESVTNVDAAMNV
jgi:hypothetical protein